MAKAKRKRPTASTEDSQTVPAAASEPAYSTRRTTRLAAAESAKRTRSGQVRGASFEAIPTVYPRTRGSSDDLTRPRSRSSRGDSTHPPPQPTTTTVARRGRRRAKAVEEVEEDVEEEDVEDVVVVKQEIPEAVIEESEEEKENEKKKDTETEKKTIIKIRANQSRPRVPPTIVTANSVTATPKSSSKHHRKKRKEDAAPLSASKSIKATPKTRQISSSAMRPPPTPSSDRNINMVVLGNACFRAWYPSYYGKDVLQGQSSIATGAASGNENGQQVSDIGSGKGKGKDPGKGKGKGGKSAIGTKESLIERLYVCPHCFKYARELVPWREHVRFCDEHWEMLGKKIYVHPRSPKGSNGSREDEGEWSVWEVDGEVDMLFCQNLSLFAKLFLDNKSVFFDVSAFNYFLLVYTPPASTTNQNPHPQVTGFFSKEKMSWDNNNLACILVFPPWQRKGLGSLLIGVSYEVSRRERLLGGPEKPISELGRKGYKRFWGSELARWLLQLRQDDASVKRLGVNGTMGLQGDEDKNAGDTSDDEDTGSGDETKLVIDVGTCSRGTWIGAEDCLEVLRDIGVAVDEDDNQPTEVLPSGTNRRKRALRHHQDDQQSNEAVPERQPKRVCLDKSAVRAWVEENRIGMERVCDPAGFVEGYAIRRPAVDEGE